MGRGLMEEQEGREGEQRGVVVMDGGKREKGRAMARKEEGKRREGGMKCVPSSQLQASPVVLGRV